MITVIVVNFNGQRTIADCVSSLLEQIYQDFRIIIIDNCSSDESVSIINDYLDKYDFNKKAVLILSKENLGFAGGNAEALKHVSTEDDIVLLNNDAVADKHWLEELVARVKENPEVGICASKLIVYGTDVTDSAGDIYSVFLKGDKRGEGRDSFRYETIGYVFGACAGAALYRRRMIEEIGFFDEDFFLIYEDADLNLRTQLTGWKVAYVPTAIVHHKVRSSIGEMSDTAVYYSVRNCEFVRIKNVPFLIFLRCLPWFILGEMTDFVYFALKHKKFAVFVKAKIDALRMLPRMWKKRKSVMKNRKVSNEYLLSMMTPVWDKDFLLSKCRKLIKH